MIETPFFFENDKYNLFGVLHEPHEASRNEGFVFVHPFAEEKLWAHLVYVNFARKLSGLGYPVLRFDVMGHGDSDGDFEETTIETQLSDIRRAIDTLRSRFPSVESVSLLGLRFGATLAAMSAESLPDIRKLVLWDPIVDGAKYMQEMLRINLTTQTAVFKEIRYTRDALVRMMSEGQTVNIDGYEMSYDLFQQASAVNLLDREKVFPGNCLIVQISKKEEAFKKDFTALKSQYKTADLILSVEEPFWKEIKLFYANAEHLFQNTLHWIHGK